MWPAVNGHNHEGDGSGGQCGWPRIVHFDRLRGQGLAGRFAFGWILIADQHIGRRVVARPDFLGRDDDAPQPLDAARAHPAGRSVAESRNLWAGVRFSA